MRTSLLGLLLFGNNALSLTIQKRFPASTYQVKESHFVPRSWSRIGSAPADHTINLRIGLTQSRFDELEKSLYEGKISVKYLHFRLRNPRIVLQLISRPVLAVLHLVRQLVQRPQIHVIEIFKKRIRLRELELPAILCLNLRETT